MSEARKEAAFEHAGALGARLAAVDWNAHPLGPPARWPSALRTAVELCLSAPDPHALVCGPQRILIYNEACAALVGARHPVALAGTLAEAWPALGKPDSELAASLAEVEARGCGAAIRVRLEGLPEQNVALTPVHAGRGVAAVALAFAPAAPTAAPVVRGEPRESEASPSELADAAPAMTWRTDVMNRCTFLGRGWLEFTGLARDGPVDRLEAMHPDDCAAAERAFVEAVARRETFSLDYRLRSADGGHRWVIDRGRPLFDAKGQWLGYVGSILDVQERKLAEQALRAELEDLRTSAERFQLIAEVSERLLGADEPLAIADELCKRVAAHLGCEVYLVYLVDEETNRLRLYAHAGIGAEEARALEWLEFGQAPCGRVALERRRLVVERVRSSDDPALEPLRAAGVDAYTCHPLIVRGRTLGTLAFGACTRPRFRDAELALMAGFASQVASAMERVLTQRRIAEIARRFRVLADAAPVMLWLSDGAGLVTFVSRGWTEFTGRSAHSALGEGWLDAVHPADRDPLRSHCYAAQAGRQPYAIEHRLLRADGVFRRVILHARPRPSGDEGSRGYVGAIVDIDDQLRTQAVLAGQKRALELALDGIDTGEVLRSLVRTAEHETTAGAVAVILVADEDGAHLRCGAAPSLPDRLRHEIDRLAQAPFAPAGPRSRGGPDAWATVRAFLESEGLHAIWWRPLVAADGALLGLFALLHPDPGAPSEEDREVVELLHATAAIALEHARIERSLAEAESNRQRFVSLVENSADFIGMADLGGEVIYVNPAGKELVGLARVGVPAISFGDYLPPESRALLRDEVLPAVMRTGQWQGEVAFRDVATGRTIPMVAAMFQIPGAHCVATVARDISERKAAEHERALLLESERAARAAAERANRVKDEFLATLSHELRTPLHAITGWAGILAEKQLSREVAHGLAVITRNSEVLKQLISDLLDMSRIVTGNARLEVEPVDLGAVVNDALEAVRLTAEAKAIRMEARLAPLEPVLGDRRRLQQVVWNLLTNALKFTSSGGRVEVELGSSGGHALITVADDGIGIAPEFLPRLFDRFTQADPASAREHGGLGIGLALVKQLTELHGGRVLAESAGPGRGSRFRVELPLRGRRAEEREVELQPEPPRRAALVLAGIEVLLVDDERDALEAVAWQLSERGARVTTAASAEDALAELEPDRFDLLVADLGMPGADGFELLRRARERCPDLPAIALTAFAGAESRADALAAGFTAHVAKPVDPVELVECVAGHAARRLPGPERPGRL